MLDKSITCGFSGYRPEKYKNWIDENHQDVIFLKDLISQSIINAYKHGYKNFICGASRGFDIWAGEAIVELSKKHDDISLMCAIPISNQSLKWDTIWRARYDELVLNSRCVFKPSDGKYPYTDRNRFIVDSSSRLICFFDGVSGGTEYTYKYAERKKLDIINLANQQITF